VTKLAVAIPDADTNDYFHQSDSSNVSTRQSIDPTKARYRIPVAKPQLPDRYALMPYLARIDNTQIYSNFGPLVQEFEASIAAYYNLPPHTVTTASSGFMALVGATLTKAGHAYPERPYCLCPSYTFSAAIAAIRRCGYEPYFVDCDPESWMLSAQQILTHPLLDKTGLIMPVAAYGRKFNMSEWETLYAETSIPIIIDAAASFDTLESKRDNFSKNIPIVLSFHATKAFGTGEGGAVLSLDADFTSKCHRTLNNGFSNHREVQSDNVNGKMSEYHAAIGLAEFNGLHQKEKKQRTVINLYQYYAEKFELQNAFHLHDKISKSYVLFLADNPVAALQHISILQTNFIETRFWYGHGMHREPAFRQIGYGSLAHTQDLGKRLIGLPCYIGLQDFVIEKICRLLKN